MTHLLKSPSSGNQISCVSTLNSVIPPYMAGSHFKNISYHCCINNKCIANIYCNRKDKKIPVPRRRNINELSGLYSLQQSLEIGSFVKILVREVLSDR